MLSHRLRDSNSRARTVAAAVIYMVAAGCDGPSGPAQAGSPGAPGAIVPTAVAPKIEETPANVRPSASVAPTSTPIDEEQLLLDHGPAAGTYSGCWSNRTEGQNHADSFSFPEGARVTEVQVFACLKDAGDADRTVRLKLLDDAGGVPGQRLIEVDATPVVQFSGSNTSAYIVSVRLGQLFIAEPGKRYWVGISGNGFEMSQTTIFRPDDGKMAEFDSTQFLGFTEVGDMTFRLFGTPVRSNRRPTAAVAVATPQPIEGSPVDFTLTAADVDGDSLYYSAAFGDGTGASGVVTSSPVTISHAYGDNTVPGAAYTMTVMVHDGRGGYMADSATFTVANVPPTVDPIADAEVSEGTSYRLRATFRDPGVHDAPYSFSIDWGDGKTTIGSTDSSNVVFASHEYAARGEYVVHVKVVDKDGGAGVTTAKVTMRNRAPSVALAGATSADEETPATFRATASDPDGDSLSFAWDFDGDGTTDATTPDSSTHRFADNGTYLVRVVVDDRHGGVDTATHRVVVANVAPTGVLTAPESVDEGGAIDLSISNLTDPSPADVEAGLLTAFSCTGESYGAFGPARTTRCTALGDGLQTVGAKVRDKDGGESTRTSTVRVNNVAPSVDAGADQVVASGETVSIVGRFSDPGVADAPWTWSWTSGQTGTSTTQGQLLVGSYRACSAARLTLTVTDKDGGVGSDAVSVTVTPAEVPIDVKADAISVRETGSVITVYVFSTATIDATTLDPATVRLTNGTGLGTSVDRRTDGSWNWVAERDLNNDGRADALFRFHRDQLIQNLDLTPTTTQLTLTGVAGGCVQVRGTDSVITR